MERLPIERWTRRFAVLAITVSLLGCGGSSGPSQPTGSVTVSITNNGEPFTFGRVDLATTRPGLGTGDELNSSGSVNLKMVPVGEYTVIVVPKPMVVVPDVPTSDGGKAPLIPEKARSEKTSPFKVDVKEGSNEFQFDLKDAS